ncbi:hypothetical protein QVD17_18586 [Tagetes erecta]|uniref:Uncharacterized protein n=1 Tax=Tagetes erecta TaxID=13708 RepID=A0AAD8NVW3_TARER|nr:hypothetical protein QVD17_18586 [Tagetes erecta]
MDAIVVADLWICVAYGARRCAIGSCMLLDPNVFDDLVDTSIYTLFVPLVAGTTTETLLLSVVMKTPRINIGLDVFLLVATTNGGCFDV